MISGIVLVFLNLELDCTCNRVCLLMKRGDIYIGVVERREIRAEGV